MTAPQQSRDGRHGLEGGRWTPPFGACGFQGFTLCDTGPAVGRPQLLLQMVLRVGLDINQKGEITWLGLQRLLFGKAGN